LSKFTGQVIETLVRRKAEEGNEGGQGEEIEGGGKRKGGRVGRERCKVREGGGEWKR